MAKKVIKELIISLLLCLAIILLLGILLYEYVPMAKTLPNPVSYRTPDNVKEELAQSENIDKEEIIMTYEVDSNDLNNYKRIRDYKPGKADPFSTYETTENKTNEGNTTAGENGNSNANNSNSGTQNGNSEKNTTTANEGNTSGGRLFKDKGTK